MLVSSRPNRTTWIESNRIWRMTCPMPKCTTRSLTCRFRCFRCSQAQSWTPPLPHPSSDCPKWCCRPTASHLSSSQCCHWWDWPRSCQMSSCSWLRRPQIHRRQHRCRRSIVDPFDPTHTESTKCTMVSCSPSFCTRWFSWALRAFETPGRVDCSTARTILQWSSTLSRSFPC